MPNRELIREWWRRDDVRRVLRTHYGVAGGLVRFVVVGRGHGWLTVVDSDIDVVLDRFPPLYLGFSVSAWEKPENVLDATPQESVIEFDLDNFPEALRDYRTLRDWFAVRDLQHAVYFTGSKGVRILAGTTSESYKMVSHWISILCTMQEVGSLDMFPYKMLEGWLQPAATIHRKSGLPAFPLHDIPDHYQELFRRSADMLDGADVPALNVDGLNGETVIAQIRAQFEALEPEEQQRVKRGAAMLRRRALSGYDA